VRGAAPGDHLGLRGGPGRARRRSPAAWPRSGGGAELLLAPRLEVAGLQGGVLLAGGVALGPEPVRGEPAAIQRSWKREGDPWLHGWVYDMRTGRLKELVTRTAADLPHPIHRLDLGDP
jgi:hypothetical protein